MLVTQNNFADKSTREIYFKEYIMQKNSRDSSPDQKESIMSSITHSDKKVCYREFVNRKTGETVKIWYSWPELLAYMGNK